MHIANLTTHKTSIKNRRRERKEKKEVKKNIIKWCSFIYNSFVFTSHVLTFSQSDFVRVLFYLDGLLFISVRALKKGKVFSALSVLFNVVSVCKWIFYSNEMRDDELKETKNKFSLENIKNPTELAMTNASSEKPFKLTHHQYN